MSLLISVQGLVVENGTFKPENLMTDIITSSSDAFVLIGIALLLAIGVGILYAIYLLLTGG